jgi:hypothetical protein
VAPGEAPSAAASSAEAPSVADIGFGTGAASASTTAGGGMGGYIDYAIVQSQFRLRFDAAYDNPFPDRAEFFYAKCGCFDPTNPNLGPPLPERRVDYQEAEAYMEYAASDRLSAFVEIPVRFINPEFNQNHAGLSDIRAGFKYALQNYCDRYLTFQLRVYTLTGDGDAGLGTEHASIEPGLLFQRNADRVTVFGELKAWVPIGGEKQVFQGELRNFSGPVVRYGLGAGYDVYRSCDCCDSQRLTAIAEFVGWTITDGLKLRAEDPNDMSTFAFQSAVNDTIVNLKLGGRWTSGQHTVYAGYGRALTGDVWYEDILRADYTFRF